MKQPRRWKSRLLRALQYGTACLLGLGLFWVIFVGEQWTTSAEELRVVLGYARSLREMQDKYFQAHGSFGELDDLILLGRFGSGRHRVLSKCQGGYCFEVTTAGEKYTLRVIPDRNAPGSRYVSVYSDQSGVIRMSYGSPAADFRSRALSEAEVQRFGGRPAR